MQFRLPLALLFSLGLTLQGCAQTAIREPSSSQTDAPNAIRTLGVDQRFSTLPSQSVARRVRAQRPEQPVNILALSGGGADGAFGAGAVVAGTAGAVAAATAPNYYGSGNNTWSGAYAAQIATMVGNEEIDALRAKYGVSVEAAMAKLRPHLEVAKLHAAVVRVP